MPSALVLSHRAPPGEISPRQARCYLGSENEPSSCLHQPEGQSSAVATPWPGLMAGGYPKGRAHAEATGQRAHRPMHAVAAASPPHHRPAHGADVRRLAPHTHRPRAARRQGDGMRRLLAAAAVAVLMRGAGGSETWTVTTIAGDGTQGYQDGTSPQTTRFGFLDASAIPLPWLIGVTVMEDDRTVLLIDNYNQAIRKIDLRTGETTTLLSTKAPCEPNKCRCGNDLTQECDDFRRHIKAQQLSGIVGYQSTAYFSNWWNEAKLDTSLPTIYKVSLASPIAVPIAHSMPTTNITFAPFGLAKGRTSAELVFTNYGASISKIDVFSGVITYIAGPTVRGGAGEEMGYRDGVGTQVQVASPMGIVTDKRRQYSYFVDSLLCNVRRLDLQTLQVTTVVGPSAFDSRGKFQCGFADGIGDAVRFTSPNGVAYLAGNRLVVSDDRDYMVRMIDLKDLSTKTLGGVKGFPGWVDGDQPAVIKFNIPSGITATSSGGTLVVTDQGSNRVRVIKKFCAPFFIVVEGSCLPCDAIACGLGYYRGMCQYDQTDGLCTKCPYELPPNSEWDINQPNCSWSCVEGYEKTATKGVGFETQVCMEAGNAKKIGFQISDQVLIGVVVAGAIVVIALTVALTWWYWNKCHSKVEIADKNPQIPSDKIEEPVYDEDTGNEDNPRDSTSKLLLQPSVVSTNKHLLQPASGSCPPAKMGSALAMHAMGSMVVRRSAESHQKTPKRRDPLAETMAELGLDDSSLGRFGARSFGTQEESFAYDIAV